MWRTVRLDKEAPSTMRPDAGIRVVRFGPRQLDDFFELHGEANGAGWCFCVAWWVPTWKGWSERTAESNRQVRQELLAAGEYDGYILFVGEQSAGWCQAGPRDRLQKLVEQFQLEPDPSTWAITCFFISPSFRGKGLARLVLQAVLEDLKNNGVRRVEAFPRRGAQLGPEELWNGPESMFLAAGFRVTHNDSIRPVLAIDLDDPKHIFR